jgi:hypothetical protein
MILDYIKKASPDYMKYYGNMSPDADSSIVPIFGLLNVAQDIRNEIVSKESRTSGTRGLLTLVKDIIKNAGKGYHTDLCGVFTRDNQDYACDGYRMVRFPSGMLPSDAFPKCEGMKSVDLFGIKNDSNEYDLPSTGELKAAKAEGLDREMYLIGGTAFNVKYLILAAQAGLNKATIHGKNDPGFFKNDDGSITLLICPMRQ